VNDPFQVTRFNEQESSRPSSTRPDQRGRASARHRQDERQRAPQTLVDEDSAVHQRSVDRLHVLRSTQGGGPLADSPGALNEFLTRFVNQGSAASPLYSRASLVSRAPCPLADFSRCVCAFVWTPAFAAQQAASVRM
jgi:hypothetical protein